ncbi:MAG: hypothetical protein EXR51_04620 [Dehalococcoidia bacterium]|nr:hypothetical protein [Dehalococcoidia bacterium]
MGENGTIAPSPCRRSGVLLLGWEEEPMTGGDLVLETLKAAGVDTVFGIASVHNLPIYDAIARGSGIRPIMVRDEQSAVYLADSYARTTGKLGVAITSTGPGAANTMGAMAEAYWANSPVLQIAGNVESPYLGKRRGFLHEAKDQLAMLSTVTKWAGQPKSTAEIPTVLAEGIRQALSGRRRPVAVDLCIDSNISRRTPRSPRWSHCRPRPQTRRMSGARLTCWRERGGR